MSATATKPWFHINKDVEYSTDFKFFSENQIRVVRTGTKHNFCSRLEAKSFATKLAFNRNGELDEADIIFETKKIHKEILAGKHHATGTFVD